MEDRASARLTLTIPEAAAAIGVSSRTLRELVARGEFPIVRVGRRVLVVKTQLAAWLNERGAVAV